MSGHADRVNRWLSDQALPLWATSGRDRSAGGFVERLLLDGTPDHSCVKRLRVQARQIYVYAHAAILGLMPDAVAVAQHGYDFVMAHGCPDGIDGGFVHAVTREGARADDRRDTYDHAFLLFAFSWFYRATSREDVRTVLMRLGDAIWTLLRHPSGEGFVVDDRTRDSFHQNPHMHLFEALLAAHEATGEPVFLERAGSLFALFRERMFDRDLGVLREFYDLNWEPAAGEIGQVVEPGHHCEWVWLLKRYADRVEEPLCDEAWRLHDFTERYGRSPGGLLLVDQVRPNGRVSKTSTRSWPQTEAIKAEIAIAEALGTSPGYHTDRLVEALFSTYLDHPVTGGWTDWVDDRGRPLVATIPASTFYHLFLAMSEYLRAQERS